MGAWELGWPSGLELGAPQLIGSATGAATTDTAGSG